MDELVRCVDVIERATLHGFEVWRVRNGNREVAAICGDRWHSGVFEIYEIRGADNAWAARYLPSEFARDDGTPLWQTRGNVIDVLPALLALPPYDTSARAQ